MREAPGKVIRALREGRGLTLQALANEMGVHIGALYRWEHGDRNPDRDGLLRLFAVFPDARDRLIDALQHDPNRKSRIRPKRGTAI